MISFADHIPVLIIVIPLISALMTLAAGWIDRRASFFITMTTVSGQFIASLFLLYRVQKQGILRYWLGGWQPPWGIEYVIDGLNAYVLVVVLLMALICVVYSKRNIEHELPQKRVAFYTLFQLLITGLCGITVTGDIFNMYVFIEIMSLSAYALTACRGKIALKASFTYLMLGSIGACFFLLGIGFLYAITGTLNMQDLSQLLPPFYGNKMALSFRESSSKSRPTPSSGLRFRSSLWSSSKASQSWTSFPGSPWGRSSTVRGLRLPRRT
jgi:multicomponent Na+:H+ antiporter subunit D